MSVRLPPSRRELLQAGGAAALSTSLALQPLWAWASAESAHAFKLGDLEISILSDGVLNVATRLLNRNMPPADIEHALGAGLSAPGQVQYAINAVLVRAGPERILIDAGAGGTWESTAGKLPDSLARAGVQPEDITKIVITHAHPDHLWGLVDEFDDSPRFPNAQYIMPGPELDYWRNVSPQSLPERMQGIALGAKRVIGTIDERLVSAAPDAEVLAGLAFIPTPGHTPGHCSVRLWSGGAGMIITADTVFHPILSFAHPEWQPLADMDGPQAVASRRRLLDMAARDRLQLAAYHIPFPGLGHVERHAGAYRWVS